MSDWQPIETAPRGEPVIVKLSTGREISATYWGKGTGWYMDALPSIVDGTHEQDFEAEFVGWRRQD